MAWVLSGIFVLALANRSVPALRGGGLSSVLGYDDAAYYAKAVGLVHGQLPYRDCVASALALLVSRSVPGSTTATPVGATYLEESRWR